MVSSVGGGGFHRIFTPEESSKVASLERRWSNAMTKLSIKEAVGRVSLWKKCHGDVDYSGNIQRESHSLVIFALNQCLFGITRKGARAPQHKKNIARRLSLPVAPKLYSPGCSNQNTENTVQHGLSIN